MAERLRKCCGTSIADVVGFETQRGERMGSLESVGNRRRSGIANLAAVQDLKTKVLTLQPCASASPIKRAPASPTSLPARLISVTAPLPLSSASTRIAMLEQRRVLWFSTRRLSV